MLSDTTYEIDALVFLLDLRWSITDRLEASLSASLAETEAAFEMLENVFADDVPTQLFPNGLPGPGADGAPVSFADYDFSEVHEMSDLEFTELRTTLALRYWMRSNMALYGAVSYFDLDDKTPYLQDATGDVTMVTTGLSWGI